MASSAEAGGDAVWTWTVGASGELRAETRAVVARHVADAALRVWRRLAYVGAVRAGGRLVLELAPQWQRWFTPTLPEDARPMPWTALEAAVRTVLSAHGPRLRTESGGYHTIGPHGALDLRTLSRDGTIAGHQLAQIALDAAPDLASTPAELLLGDPRFAAPELWAGEEPTLESDLFAVAAIYCERHTPLSALAGPLDRVHAPSLLPRQRVPPSDSGDSQSLLLSLLALEPRDRRYAAELLCEPPAAPRSWP